MNTLTRIERLFAASLALTNVTEQGGNNHGQMVELFLHGVGLPAGAPWCAAFVHHVGFWSQFDPKRCTSAWPLPATGACQVLGDFATRHQALVNHPLPGDLFLLYLPTLNRFAHTGIVLDVQDTPSAFLCTTIEGNTTNDGGRDGWKSALKRRCIGKHDGHAFIRWTALIGVSYTIAMPSGPITLPQPARAA